MRRSPPECPCQGRDLTRPDFLQLKESTLKFILLIVDGVGLRDSKEANAFKLSRTPVFDKLFSTCPWSRLEAAGRAVGLPNGVVGNSEVGHLTIGAGRIIKHDLIRINDAIGDGTLGQIPELQDVFAHVRKKGSSLHLMGLLSDGRVHSHIEHLLALLRIAKKEGMERVFVHAITDGRDTSPTSGVRFLRDMLNGMNEIGLGVLSTIMGRYYAMDRDKRWDRTELAYRAYVEGEGERFQDPVEAVTSSYEENVTDEFIKPRIIVHSDRPSRQIRGDDALLCFNFRADRMRQITTALGGMDFHEFSRSQEPVFTTTFTRYDDKFTFPVLFSPKSMENVFGTVLENHGFRQLRVAETEKYAHVTYFFNGGNETPYPHEDRILVPSPKVATYDLKPEMSAEGVEDTVLQAIDSGNYDCVIVNLANPDMVGHTGDLEASIKAVEVVDGVVGNILASAGQRGAVAFVTSDHGNLELMVNESTGGVHTAHTLNPVPFFIVNPGNRLKLKSKGELADVAPTILDFFNIPIPQEMTGKSLVVRP